MTTSLRRTLALRFAATMAVGLAAAAGAVYWATTRVLHDGLPPGGARVELLVALAAVVAAGTAATLIGAWRLAGSAVQPVGEIIAQAKQIEGGTLDRRIAAHAGTEEYRGLVAVLNGMLDRLERAFRSQRRLTADVSHELRSPLTALRGEIEVALRADRSPREYQLVLRSALEEIDRLTVMAEDLLLISRAESHLLTPRRSPTDLDDLVRAGLERLRARIAEKEITVERALTAQTRALVDPVLTERAIDHLLDNAVKFSPTSGDVRVATAREDGRVRVTVRDSGAGLTPDDLAHVFEPFYRADAARSRGTGTGLSLALVAAIVRLHGGEVTAANAPGGGARFDVVLPAAVDA